jgi:hypothetical protein
LSYGRFAHGRSFFGSDRPSGFLRLLSGMQAFRPVMLALRFGLD